MQGFVIGWAFAMTGLTLGALVSIFDLKRMLRAERARSERLYNIAFGYDEDKPVTLAEVLEP